MAKGKKMVEGLDTAIGDLENVEKVQKAKRVKTFEELEIEREYKEKLAELRKSRKQNNLSERIDEAIKQLERLKADPMNVIGVSIMVRIEGEKIAKSITSVL